MDCRPTVYLSCDDTDTIFGPKTTNKVQLHLRVGEIIRLDAFTLTDDIEIFLLDQDPGATCADCGTGLRIPYAPCGDAKVLNQLNKIQYLKGPGVFELESKAPNGVPYVRMAKLNTIGDEEFCAQNVPACVDTTWTPTGDERCVGNDVLREETSNCGTSRWVTDRPTTWTPTGQTRCNNNVVEVEEENDCKTTRWVATAEACGFCASYPVPRDLCEGQSAYAFRECDVKDPLATVEIADCDGGNKVYVYPTCGAGHSIPVKDCEGNLIGYGVNVSECVQNETLHMEIGSLPTINLNPVDLKPIEISKIPTIEVAPLEIESLPTIEVAPLTIESIPDVKIAQIPDLKLAEVPVLEFKKQVVASEVYQGVLYYIWSDGTKTTETLPPEPVVYCPSLRISCDGQAGYGYHIADPKDPAATVEMASCDVTADSIWIYPTAGAGHTIKVLDCDNNVIGYAANKSDCAGDCGCSQTEVKVTNNFKPTTNVAAPNVVMPSASLVSMAVADDGSITATNSDGTTVTSNPLPSC